MKDVAVCFLLLLTCFAALAQDETVLQDEVDKNSIELSSVPKKSPAIALSKVLKKALGSLKLPSKTTAELIGRVLTRALSSFEFPGDLSLSSHAVQLMAAAGAVLLGVVGVAAVAALLLPLLGVRACNLVGSCADHFAYASQQPAHAYDAYSAAGTFNQPTPLAYAAAAPASSADYQKRSLDYMGPILEALSTAYDKYDKMIVKGKP